MSVPVPLERLADTVVQYGLRPYLLTSGADGRPRAISLALTGGDELWAEGVGRRTAANVAERPAVALLWPPVEPGGYSLIVDGVATLELRGDDTAVRIEATRAVLHRSAPAPEGAPTACTSDCVPLDLA